MAIENRNLPVGTRLVASYKKEGWTLEVLPDEEARFGFVGKRPAGGAQAYKSLSAAASAIMGGKAVNGWRFWSLEGDAPAATEAETKPEKKARGSRKNKPSKTITKMRDQAGAGEGETRYFCSACMDGFAVEGTDEPEACPKGHRNDDPELNAPSGVSAAEEAEVKA